MTLFDTEPAGRVRHSDPQTSVDAARSVTEDIPALVRDALARYGPMTADELCEKIPRFGPSVKSAIARAGVVDSGVKRPSRTGRASIVWRLA